MAMSLRHFHILETERRRGQKRMHEYFHPATQQQHSTCGASVCSLRDLIKAMWRMAFVACAPSLTTTPDREVPLRGRLCTRLIWTRSSQSKWRRRTASLCLRHPFVGRSHPCLTDPLNISRVFCLHLAVVHTTGGGLHRLQPGCWLISPFSIGAQDPTMMPLRCALSWT